MSRQHSLQPASLVATDTRDCRKQILDGLHGNLTATLSFMEWDANSRAGQGDALATDRDVPAAHSTMR